MEVFSKNILNGQAGIVTGGTSGIGLAIARYLIEHGAKVTVVGRNQEKLDAACSELGENATGVCGDVRDSTAIASNLETHMEKHGKVDFLINNAAGNFLSPLEGLNEKGFRAVNDIVCMGTFLWSKAVFPHMKKAKYGRIVQTGTGYADSQAGIVGHSGAAKAATLSLTRTMAVEWARFGIVSNYIAPGPIKGTEGVSRLMPDGKSEEIIAQLTPVPRLGEGWEIGGLVTFLLSPLASYINGAHIRIDGGLSLTTPGLFPSQFIFQAAAHPEQFARA